MPICCAFLVFGTSFNIKQGSIIDSGATLRSFESNEIREEEKEKKSSCGERLNDESSHDSQSSTIIGMYSKGFDILHKSELSQASLKSPLFYNNPHVSNHLLFHA